MPLQIKELHIKVSVNADEEQNTPSGGGAATQSTDAAPVDKGEIISECIDQIMEILKENKEP